jgi:hypothetical protein
LDRKIYRILALLSVIVIIAIMNLPFSSGQVGDVNFILTPTTNSAGDITTSFSATLSISTSIKGTSSSSGALVGCSSSVTYLWDYQNNLPQPSSGSGNYSWIQQVLEFGKTASCYTIEYWPDLHLFPNTVDVNSSMLTTYPNLWNTSGNQVAFSIEGTSPSTSSYDTVYAFELSGSGAHSETAYIYPFQLTNSPTITYYSSSQEDFGVVGTGNGAFATFTGGSGTITYSGVLPFTGACETIPISGGGTFFGGPGSGLCYQTGENSTMVYSDIASNNVQTFSAENIVQMVHAGEAGQYSLSETLSPKSTSDLLVVGVGSNYNPVTALNDSQGNTYTELSSASNSGGPSDSYASIWYTKPESTSSDTINIYTGSGGDADVFIYEISNAQKEFTSSTGSGAYTVTPSVSQFTPYIGFVLGVVGDNVGCQSSLAAGTNYTLYTTSPNYRGISEYSLPWPKGSTTAPFSGSFSCSASGYQWSEAAIAIHPQ